LLLADVSFNQIAALTVLRFASICFVANSKKKNKYNQIKQNLKNVIHAGMKFELSMKMILVVDWPEEVFGGWLMEDLVPVEEVVPVVSW
jgi:uncharacterized membrane protein